MLKAIGLLLMLVGLCLIGFSFLAAAIASAPPPTADENGSKAVEAVIKNLEDLGVNIGLLAFCAAFAVFTIVVTHL